MDPREFQYLARLLSSKDDAARCRTAISRAYYAVHHVAVHMLSQMAVSIPQGPGGHTAVWDCLSNSGDTEVKDAGHKTANLYAKRVRADYHLDKRDVEKSRTARGYVDDAEQMIGLLEKCCKDPARLHRMSESIRSAAQRLVR